MREGVVNSGTALSELEARASSFWPTISLRFLSRLGIFFSVALPDLISLHHRRNCDQRPVAAARRNSPL